MKFVKFSILTIITLLIFSSQIFATWAQGKPAPDQKSFMIFETSWKTRLLGSTIQPSNENFLVSTELGFMKNISPKKSIGATLYLSGDDDGSLIGIRYRQRHWIEKNVSFEFSPGIILFGNDNKFDVKSLSFIGSVSINVRDLLSFEIHAQAIRYSTVLYNYDTQTSSLLLENKSGTQTSLYMGAKFGSFVAVGTVVGVFIVAAIFADQTDVNF